MVDPHFLGGGLANDGDGSNLAYTPESEEGGLTSMPQRIHCSATEEGGSESDRIAIDSLLDILAEVALAIAARRRGKG